jgi:predicted nucleic acid-binding protein
VARYLLDTNTCVVVMRSHAVAVQRMAAVAPGDCAISTVTAYDRVNGGMPISQLPWIIGMSPLIFPIDLSTALAPWRGRTGGRVPSAAMEVGM